MDYYPRDNLKFIFYKNKLLDLQIIKDTSKTNIIPPKISIFDFETIPNPNELTPIGKMIYDTAHKDDKINLLIDLSKDDIELNKNQIINELKDLDYKERMENNKLGFYMEKYVSVNFKCPICNEYSLKQYANPNIPVVDLLCINKQHYNSNFSNLFQVKISTGFSSYFSHNFINVGSKKYGFNCHHIKGNDSNDVKKLLINYICINLNYDQNKNIYDINKKNSFILIPDPNNTTDQYYYSYNGNTIFWNKSMFINSYNFNNIDLPIINPNDIYIEKIIYNPFQYYNVAKSLFNFQNAGYYYKYLKYKNKYNKLKKSLSNYS